MSVAVNARQAHHKVCSVIYKGRDLAGFTLGRLHLDRKITEPELEAGIWFAEWDARYRAAVGLKPANVQAQNLLKVKGYEGEETETMQQRATKASNMMMKMDGILVRAGVGVKQTVRNVCVEDIEELRLMGSAQLRLLKTGLLALALSKGAA